MRQRLILKDRQSKLCWNQSGESPRLKVRLTEQCHKVCGAERRLHQKGRLCNKRRLGLVQQRIRQLRSMRWRWKTSYVGRMGSTRLLHGMRAKRHLQPEGGPHCPSEETPKEETAMEIDDARLLPEFDAVLCLDAERPSYHRADGSLPGQ